MIGSASPRPPEPAELCRLAHALVATIRRHTDPAPLNLNAVDLVSSGRMSDWDHTVCLTLMCAQRLHNLGLQRDTIDLHELFIVTGTLGFMLGRLDLNGSRNEVDEIQNRLHEIAMNLSITDERVYPEPG
ncbi:MAG: hypothetical protein ACT4O0_03135 [Pseudonocardia sp.]